MALDLGGVAGRARLMETRLGLKPDWGKLNVRNFREGAGNVTMGAGLRPTAKAGDMPPDPTVRAPALNPTGKGRLEKGEAIVPSTSLAAYFTVHGTLGSSR